MLLLLLAISLFYCEGYLLGDRIDSQIRCYHSKWKTAWSELPLNQMPIFGSEHSAIVRFELPSGNGAIDVSEDVKISLAFSNQKIVIPQIIAFDSDGRRSLDVLTVIFIHDEFDLVRVDFKTEYGDPIRQLDVSHPSLKAFKIVYTWDNSIQVDDLNLGVTVLFWCTVIFSAIFMVTTLTNERSSDLDFRIKHDD